MKMKDVKMNPVSHSKSNQQVGLNPDSSTRKTIPGSIFPRSLRGFGPKRPPGSPQDVDLCAILNFRMYPREDP